MTAVPSGHPGTDGHRRPGVPRGAVQAHDGLLLVDKHAGVTSHDIVAMTRRLAATRKVGHAGTLDPMATGLLILGIGRATRFLTYLVGSGKTYEATVRLGQETLTEDAEGEVTAAAGCRPPSSHPGGEEAWRRELDAALAGLTGPIMQVPSAVSAIKVGGVRSYARVRGGEDVTLAARPVTIDSLEVTGGPRAHRLADATDVVDLDLAVSCSSGTYIRALARDLGHALGCGAHLTALRRTAVGPFAVREADDVEALAAQVDAAAGEEPPRGLTTMPVDVVARRVLAALELTAEEARAVGYGQALPAEVLDRAEGPSGAGAGAAASGSAGADRPVPASEAKAAYPAPSQAPPGPHDDAAVRPVAAFAPDGRVVALLTRKDGRARPVLVLAPS